MALSAAAFALPGSLSAALSVYEPFNYSAASTLGGQNGGTAALMVLRADFVSSGGDTFKPYINPSNSAEPASADAAKSGYDVGTFSTIQFNGNLGFSIDELKIGSSYADVVPETGTWGSMLAVTGIGCITWFRQRNMQRAEKTTEVAALPSAD